LKIYLELHKQWYAPDARRLIIARINASQANSFDSFFKLHPEVSKIARSTELM
jgi:hypothetical protein